MNIEVVVASAQDKDFILYANKEIDEVSNIDNSALKDNIDKDLFTLHKPICLIAKDGERRVGMTLFSKVYWADRGEGVYISQVFVEKEYRKYGIFKQLLKEVFNFYEDTQFVTCLVARDNQTMRKCMDNVKFEYEDMCSYVINKEDFIS